MFFRAEWTQVWAVQTHSVLSSFPRRVRPILLFIIVRNSSNFREIKDNNGSGKVSKRRIDWAFRGYCFPEYSDAYHPKACLDEN